MNNTKFEQYNTQDLWQKDIDHVIHPWAVYPQFEDEGTLILAEGRGAYVYDTEGKQYLDGIGGIWCVNIGYGREEMANAIAKQVMQIPYFNSQPLRLSRSTMSSSPPVAPLLTIQRCGSSITTLAA